MSAIAMALSGLLPNSEEFSVPRSRDWDFVCTEEMEFSGLLGKRREWSGGRSREWDLVWAEEKEEFRELGPERAMEEAEDE
jgi:hypothetical protein